MTLVILDPGRTLTEVPRGAILLAQATDRQVIELEPSELWAVDEADAVRAGALRDYLGIPGQGRDSALTYQDLIALRHRLLACGVPTVPCGPIRHGADVYRFAHQRGYPIRLRQRRVPDWPVVAGLATEEETNAFTEVVRGGPGEVWPLVAEPVLVGERIEVTGGLVDGRWVIGGGGGSASVRELAGAALAVLPSCPGARQHRIALLRTAEELLIEYAEVVR